MPATERAVLQEQLIDIILEVLRRNPQLHYYQGYHDVAVTLLLVVGKRMALAMLDTLSNYHLRLYFFLNHLKYFLFFIFNYLLCLQGFHGSYHGQHQTHFKLSDAYFGASGFRITRLHDQVNTHL